MAYTETRTDRAGRTVHVGRYRVDGRLRSTRQMASRRDALATARRLEEAGKRGEWVDPAASRITVAEWFDSWQAGRADRAPRTLEAERERFRSLVAPRFGDVPLRQVTHEDVTRWSATMVSPITGEVASAARRRDAMRLLVSLLDAAVDARRLPANPARSASGKVTALPRAPRTKPHRYLTHEQLRRVADAAGAPGTPSRTMVLLTALTGLRWGEVSALTVSDVDPLRARLSVTKAYTRLDDGTLLLGDTKTHARREVPLPAVVAEDVAALMTGRAPGDLLFPGATGAPLRRESFDRSAFRPAVRAAGAAVSILSQIVDAASADGVPADGARLSQAGRSVYDDVLAGRVRRLQSRHGIETTGTCGPETWAVLAELDRPRRDGLTRGQKLSRTRLLATLARTTLAPGAEDFDTLTLHDLRHTAASLAIAGGASVKAVQRLLGHESPVLTLSTYAGLFEDDLDAVGEVMSAGFAAAGPPRPAAAGQRALRAVPS
ncbi:tyrosine-type recombinase/integrase [Myceligenerans pegani]|uniref:Tyrosine-type recombinase/integrase n=1 Tax=Myceligenerans pegani TaxID=2776917 RepID=A0ABR9MU77_9MICO|nr:tyrosine-type recombinase/integrase [Myceligenerans sp. TRM 65318]MBE1874932.1 tyrosine-type recombinase/integrase [Myceligenerans sp. TRM 65318]MBE3017203.1 tyrosine-type recombinase/integrase [Myceligenerans sp. TRM 65318]